MSLKQKILGLKRFRVLTNIESSVTKGEKITRKDYVETVKLTDVAALLDEANKCPRCDANLQTYCPNVKCEGYMKDGSKEQFFDKKLYEEDHEKAYVEACKHFYPAIKEADVVFVYVPDGIGQHTKRDLDYAKSCGKLIGIASKGAQQEIDDCKASWQNLKDTIPKFDAKIAYLETQLESHKQLIVDMERERGEQKQKLQQFEEFLVAWTENDMNGYIYDYGQKNAHYYPSQDLDLVLDFFFGLRELLE